MPRILTTEESLLNYAAWYAMRYFPSFQKLRESLMKKSANNRVLTEKVMEQMAEYISEERTVDGLVRMYTEQSKTRPYIEQKLRLKKFQSDIIVTTLEKYEDSFLSWSLYEPVIGKKIGEYLEKNKSKKYITGTLLQKYPNFKREILDLTEELAPDESFSVEEEFIRLSKKYDVTNRNDRQKIIQKLCLKGFPYRTVQRVIEEKLENLVWN